MVHNRLDFSQAESHANRMNRMYRYQRHIYDFTRKYYLFGRDRTIEGLRMPPGATLLEIGCGTGRNLLLAHRLYPEARLYGLDISAAMLETAHAGFRGKSKKPVLHIGDATDFKTEEFGVQGFDRILISYALSMIPGWQTAMDSALSALLPGGSLHIVDFGQQEHLPRWFGQALQAWLRRFHVTPRADLLAALESRLAETNADMVLEEIGGGYAWHIVIRRRG